MKRRDVIKGGVVAALATGAAAVSAPAIAANRIEITMVATWGRDFPGLGTGAQRFAERLTEMTDGRIKVNYFAAGERVHTEHSHKYDIEGFQALVARAGWCPVQVWTDQDRLFSVHVLETV